MIEGEAWLFAWTYAVRVGGISHTRAAGARHLMHVVCTGSSMMVLLGRHPRTGRADGEAPRQGGLASSAHPVDRAHPDGCRHLRDDSAETYSLHGETADTYGALMTFDGLDDRQSFALIAEITSTRNLLHYGTEAVESARFTDSGRGAHR
jgi:hypothetical protein